ncbi:hypothetical protein TcCL_Unassigned01994 [Trypanosoma cruzi]|nr:hypothetical protein TcCL_Unassigned01994 [Trypanosoma cruzi]
MCVWMATCKTHGNSKKYGTQGDPAHELYSPLVNRSRNSKRPPVAFLGSRFIIITPPQQRVPASEGDDCSIAPRVGGAHNVSLRPRAVSNKPHGRTQHNSPTHQ